MSGEVGRVRFRDVAEVVGVIAVILSLVFVGLELHANTRAQRAQVRQELANASRDWLLTTASDPTLAASYNTIFGGEGSPMSFADTTLTPLDSLRGRILMIAAVRNIENVWIQAREGIVDENVLDSYAFQAAVWQSPGFREFWRAYLSSQVDTDFARAFEEINDLR